MFTTQQAVDTALRADLTRANMTTAPRPDWEAEPFHFSEEYRDVTLRHVWTMARAAEARQIQERGIPRWI